MVFSINGGIRQQLCHVLFFSVAQRKRYLELTLIVCVAVLPATS